MVYRNGNGEKLAILSKIFKFSLFCLIIFAASALASQPTPTVVVEQQGFSTTDVILLITALFNFGGLCIAVGVYVKTIKGLSKSDAKREHQIEKITETITHIQENTVRIEELRNDVNKLDRTQSDCDFRNRSSSEFQKA